MKNKIFSILGIDLKWSSSDLFRKVWIVNIFVSAGWTVPPTILGLSGIKERACVHPEPACSRWKSFGNAGAGGDHRIPSPGCWTGFLFTSCQARKWLQTEGPHLGVSTSWSPPAPGRTELDRPGALFISSSLIDAACFLCEYFRAWMIELDSHIFQVIQAIDQPRGVVTLQI